MRNDRQGQSKFLKFITLPLRALGKARDLYVRGITGCAARAHYSSGIALPLPKSRSSSSASSRRPSDFAVDEDYSELIRAASVRSMGHKNEIDMFLHQHQQLQQRRQRSQISSAAAKAGLPKSSSVGMAKIDEDSEFGDEGDHRTLNHKVSDRFYPRSRSCAVPGGSSTIL